MRIRLGSPPLVALLAAVLAGSGVGWGQETQAPRAPELLVPVSTELVRIDVVVTQKGGQPRVGLKQDDFVVLEDGQPQPITQFEWFVSEPSPPAGAAAAATGAADETAPPRPIPPRRYVVLAVDDVHMEAGSLIRIKKALDRFLEREVGPEDQIALVNTAGSRRLYQEFTDDRHALRRSIDRLTVQDRSVVHTGVPYITEYQAELIARGDEDALRVAIEETMQAGLYRDEDNAEKHSRAVARSVHTESVHYGRMTLETLESVVRSLSELQGRKVIALVSDGFLTGLTANATSAFDIRRIADAGTRAGVVIYALDTRGLVATTAGMSASSRMPVQSSTFSSRDIMVRDGERATREAMNALSMDTGGFLIESANDLNGGLRRILKDTETYYVIAYEPTNTRRDGAFRKLEVRLPSLKDVRIRTRKGYFAPDERRLAATRKNPPVIEEKPDPLEPPPAEDELKTALTSVAPLNGIPVRLSADFVSLDDTSPQLVVSSSVDLGGIPFVMDQQRRVATVAAGAMVFDESGAPVGTLEPQRVAMNLTDEAFARALKSGLLYQKAAPVKPGRYRVRFVARDEASGKAGSASAWVEVPALEGGELSLSSLFLLKRDDRGASASPPTSPDQGPNLREVQAQRRYRKGEDLYVQLFAYNPKRDQAGTTNLIAQAEVWRSGALLASSAPESLAAEDGSARIAHLRSINIKPFEPGNYEVRLVITDQNAKRMASRRAGFTIVE